MAKRLFDWLVSSIALFLLLPLFLLLAFLIKIDSKGPVLFRQQRVGFRGKPFFIHKFRTMVVDAERYGALITVGSDPRITRVGSWLRLTKLDELPQLFDVWIGEMSFVGPRPEVPFYVQFYPPDCRQLIFSVRPGITDLASIAYSYESEILARYREPSEAYIKIILPAKIEYCVNYVRCQSFMGDILIILATLRKLFCSFFVFP